MEKMERRGLEVINTNGITAMRDRKEAHYDIVKLAYGNLRGILEIVLESISTEKIKQYRGPELKRLLCESSEDGRLGDKYLNGSLKKEIEKYKQEHA